MTLAVLAGAEAEWLETWLPLIRGIHQNGDAFYDEALGEIVRYPGMVKGSSDIEGIECARLRFVLEYPELVEPEALDRLADRVLEAYIGADDEEPDIPDWVGAAVETCPSDSLLARPAAGSLEIAC